METDRRYQLWSVCYYFSTSGAVYMAERLLTVPPRDHGVLLWKLVSTVPAAVELHISENPS